MDSKNAMQAVTVYGSSISYFTGKLENYFRIKGIPYTLRSMQGPQDMKMAVEKVGVSQMPFIELADGRWMTDTTKIIQWFESQYPQNPLIPRDPMQAFICFLIEDYADEWLWRPAMHYRWHYPEGAYHLSRHIVDEHMSKVPLPGALKRWLIRRRQRNGYTTGDGISKDNVPAVEGIYLRTLQQLQTIFEQRPFILGERPSLADIGLSGPFFRHFGLDPIPQEIMRQQAPAVYEWVARLWNTQSNVCAEDYEEGIPSDLGPMLQEIGSQYLPYLCANVEAVAAGEKNFDVEINGSAYRGARYSRYRVWCLQELQSRFKAMPEEVQHVTRILLKKYDCWEPLWRHQQLPLLAGQERELPFRASSKMVGVNE